MSFLSGKQNPPKRLAPPHGVRRPFFLGIATQMKLRLFGGGRAAALLIALGSLSLCACPRPELGEARPGQDLPRSRQPRPLAEPDPPQSPEQKPVPADPRPQGDAQRPGFGTGPGPAPSGPDTCQPDFAALAARIRHYVLPVIHQSRDRRGKGRYGLGSGILVNARGQVLTNAHVVAGAQRVIVELQDHRQVQAKVLAIDPRVDLALLQLPDFDPRGFQAPEWSQEPVAAGQWALCMGHPFGLGHTVTVGVISGLGRDYDDLGRPPGLLESGWWSFLQLDAAINVGNSGGPVVDREGRIIGIATAVRNDGQGLAFAVPAAMAQRFLKDVQNYGALRAVVLGMRVREVGPEVFPSRLQSVEVQSLKAGGAAALAGLRVGDIILQVQGRNLLRISTLIYEAQRLGPGKKLHLRVRSKPLASTPTRDVVIDLRTESTKKNK